MKILIFLLILIVGFTLVGESYAQRQAAPQGDPSLIEVTLQMQLRNSEEQLISYMEPTTMFVLNINMVHDYLDTRISKENKKIIEKDGEMFELIEYELFYRMDGTRQIATLGMVHQNTFVLLFRHDGYVSSPGDTLYAHWKIIRTIQ